MSSSISSSEGFPLGRAPDGRWGRTWLAALLVALLTLSAWELFVRSRGYRPTLPDDDPGWVQKRAALPGHGANAIALLGSSVLQAAVSADLLASETGLPLPAHLEVTGSSALPVLEDLAADDRFSGLTIIEYNPGLLFSPRRNADLLAQGLVDLFHRHEASPFDWVEHRLRLLARGRVAFRSAALTRWVLRRALSGEGFPDPPHLTVAGDGTLRFDWSHTDPRAAPGVIDLVETPRRLPTEAHLERQIERAGAAIDRIRSRGGEAVFVTISCDGPYRDELETLFPREWAERLTESTATRLLEPSAALHLDEESLRCPDGGHLELESQRRFTRALARILVEAILPQRPGG